MRSLATLAVIALVAGCAGGSSPGWTAPETLAPGSPTAGSGGPVNTPDTSVTFAGAALTLPAGWQATHYDVVSSFFQLNHYLGPQAVPDPCTRTANSGACSRWPAIQLPANGILAATWYMGGPPGNVPDVTSGEAVTVAGRSGRLALVEVDPGCRSMGGDAQLRVIVPSEAIWNWEQLDACLRGPDHAAGEATIRGLITGLAPRASQEPMSTSAAIPNDNGFVEAPGRLRLRLMTLTFPSAWNATREPYARADRVTIATLGSMTLPACNWVACGTWPAIQLAPNAIVISVWASNNSDLTLATAPGDSISVAGGPGKLQASPADQGCSAIGGEEQLAAFVPSDPAGGYLYEFDACLRGPDLTTNERLFRQILESGVPSPHYEG